MKTPTTMSKDEKEQYNALAAAEFVHYFCLSPLQEDQEIFIELDRPYRRICG